VQISIKPYHSIAAINLLPSKPWRDWDPLLSRTENLPTLSS
jgi:hypothetical protein